jgi:hypothetical protein
VRPGARWTIFFHSPSPNSSFQPPGNNINTPVPGTFTFAMIAHDAFEHVGANAPRDERRDQDVGVEDNPRDTRSKTSSSSKFFRMTPCAFQNLGLSFIF